MSMGTGEATVHLSSSLELFNTGRFKNIEEARWRLLTWRQLAADAKHGVHGGVGNAAGQHELLLSWLLQLPVIPHYGPAHSPVKVRICARARCSGPPAAAAAPVTSNIHRRLCAKISYAHC